ncbi:MAG: aminoglycoside phosphotransferase family protein [Oscillospiraceae bacterium]
MKFAQRHDIAILDNTPTAGLNKDLQKIIIDAIFTQIIGRKNMLNEVFKNYKFKHPEAIFIRHNENMTYMVKDDNQKYLLRIHKTIDGLDLSHGCRNIQRQALISSEIELLNQLHAAGGIKTQRPVKNNLGKYITYLENGVSATVLTWLDGEDLQKTVISDELAYKIGETIGKLHNAMSNIPGRDRYIYDETYIDKVSNDINAAYELKHIAERHYKPMQEVLSCVRRTIVKERWEFVFLHADLSKSNLIQSHGEICPIDFSLSGYSLPDQDLADINWTLHNEKLTPSLFTGYEAATERTINHFFFRMFTALYPISYIASHHNKIDQDEKFIQTLDRWCHTVLNPFIISQQ